MRHFWEWMEDHTLIVEAAQYISPDEYEERLHKLGWRIESNGSHRTAFAPDSIGKVTWTVNNWEKNWHQIARDLLRFAKAGRSSLGGYKNLEFVWLNPFTVPKNFNYKTQEIDTENISQNIMVSKLLSDPNVLSGHEIKQGGGWKRVELADHGNDGTSIEVMFDDGSMTKLGMQQTITMRMAA